MAKGKAASRKRLAAILGGVVGGGLGVLLNYFLFYAIGSGYPIGPTTFALFAAGAFGGMALSDRLGKKALRVMGIGAGVLMALSVLAYNLTRVMNIIGIGALMAAMRA